MWKILENLGLHNGVPHIGGGVGFLGVGFDAGE